jgi:hypothetical protein
MDHLIPQLDCGIVSAGTARKKVLSALANMPDVETDYSEPIDLIVVKPLMA